MIVKEVYIEKLDDKQIRDMFAMHAMQAFIARGTRFSSDDWRHYIGLAEEVYAIANKMMEERAKRDE